MSEPKANERTDCPKCGNGAWHVIALDSTKQSRVSGAVHCANPNCDYTAVGIIAVDTSATLRDTGEVDASADVKQAAKASAASAPSAPSAPPPTPPAS